MPFYCVVGRPVDACADALLDVINEYKITSPTRMASNVYDSVGY